MCVSFFYSDHSSTLIILLLASFNNFPLLLLLFQHFTDQPLSGLFPLPAYCDVVPYSPLNHWLLKFVNKQGFGLSCSPLCCAACLLLVTQRKSNCNRWLHPNSNIVYRGNLLVSPRDPYYYGITLIWVLIQLQNVKLRPLIQPQDCIHFRFFICEYCKYPVKSWLLPHDVKGLFYFK